jgi:hypothetical protein
MLKGHGAGFGYWASYTSMRCKSLLGYCGLFRLGSSVYSLYCRLSSGNVRLYLYRLFVRLSEDALMPVGIYIGETAVSC